MRTEIIYEDKDILVIYKPAGLATQTSRVGQADVVSELKNYLSVASRGGVGSAKGAPYLGVIHRLDQPVEGLLVFAKNKQAAANLTAQLQNRENVAGFHKHYYAVVCGASVREQGVLENFLYKDKDNKAVIVEEAEAHNVQEAKAPSGNEAKSGETSSAKKAKLEYRLIKSGDVHAMEVAGQAAQDNTGQIHLVEVLLHTGRFHQIRAQMACAGNPLLGDQKYGTSVSVQMSAEMGVRNVALCAYRLEFRHPGTGEQKSFEINPRGPIFGLFF